jgi:hypothetical protein
VDRSIRPTWVTVTWLALLLVLVAFAAGQTRLAQAPPTGMVAAFVDTNGNDIDDSCEDPATVAAEVDPEAEASAEAAVDTDGDGTISVSEAAHSGRIGGKNCNHGGYVSWVAHGSCDELTPQEPVTEPVTGPALDAAPVTTEVCAEDSAEEAADEAAADDPTTECVEVAPPERDPAIDEQKNGHGKWVSTVAQSGAIGGKNCNHGGAVSEAAKKDHEAARAARDAAKAEKKAAREAAKAEKKAAREAAKAARDAAKLAKEQGKGNSKNH